MGPFLTINVVLTPFGDHQGSLHAPDNGVGSPAVAGTSPVLTGIAPPTTEPPEPTLCTQEPVLTSFSFRTIPLQTSQPRFILLYIIVQSGSIFFLFTRLRECYHWNSKHVFSIKLCSPGT